jgi:hypothetical protein
MKENIADTILCWHNTHLTFEIYGFTGKDARLHSQRLHSETRVRVFEFEITDCIHDVSFFGIISDIQVIVQVPHVRRINRTAQWGKIKRSLFAILIS